LREKKTAIIARKNLEFWLPLIQAGPGSGEQNIINILKIEM